MLKQVESIYFSWGAHPFKSSTNHICVTRYQWQRNEMKCCQTGWIYLNYLGSPYLSSHYLSSHPLSPPPLFVISCLLTPDATDTASPSAVFSWFFQHRLYYSQTACVFQFHHWDNVWDKNMVMRTWGIQETRWEIKAIFRWLSMQVLGQTEVGLRGKRSQFSAVRGSRLLFYPKVL